jgi:hypothetical protein
MMNIFALIHTTLSKVGIKIPAKHINKFTLTGFVFLFWVTFLDGGIASSLNTSSAKP